jgi:hypothetical protein
MRTENVVLGKHSATTPISSITSFDNEETGVSKAERSYRVRKAGASLADAKSREEVQKVLQKYKNSMEKNCDRNCRDLCGLHVQKVTQTNGGVSVLLLCENRFFDIIRRNAKYKSNNGRHCHQDADR